MGYLIKHYVDDRDPACECGAETVAAYLNACASKWQTHGFNGGSVVFGLSPEEVLELYNLYHGNPASLTALFKMWNENARDPLALQIVMNSL